jgi:hypothetical protein
MNILHYVDAIFIKLSAIPGLGFLHEYVEELEIQQQRRRILTEQYRGYAGALREAGDAAKHGGHGHGGHGHGGHDEHEGQGKHSKKAGRGGRWGRPAPGGKVARPSRKEEDESEEDYEDDDFESYLQY